VIYIIDTHAWIEYFTGSKQGYILDKLLNNLNNRIITMECCIGELHSFCLKNNVDFNKMHAAVKKNSLIFPVLKEHWIEAGKLKVEMRKKIKNFGLIDAILLAKQNELGCKLVTGDFHFKNLKNIVFLE